MKKIVAAVDFNEEFEDVIDHAAALATGLGAELHVLHVYPPTPVVVQTTLIFPPAVAGETIEEHEELLQREKQKIREIVDELHKKDLKACGYMKPADDHIADAIKEFSGEIGADLLILGNHRPRRVERLVFGSTAEQVFRKSTIPVLVIPRPKATTQ